MDNPFLKYLAFAKTVETGSFTRAAGSLNYTQSSVSKMIADLEKEWGLTLLERSGIRPRVRFTTWEDYAIMAMVEKGLGIGILPDMILQRIPYRLEIRPLAQPYYREIVLAMRDRQRLTPAAQRFLSYLRFREGPLPYFAQPLK